MKEICRNLLVSLLLLIPVILLNYAYGNIAALANKWEQRDQERFARQKLNEIAAQTDIIQQISATANTFKNSAASVLEEYPERDIKKLPVMSLAERTFATPFPEYELWVFHAAGLSERPVVFSAGDPAAPRRPMEMLAAYLVSENRGVGVAEHERRRNEKLLQRIFGNGCSGELMGQENAGVTTPVIYKGIPSFLVWDYFKTARGEILSFFLIIQRNQDLVKSSYFTAAAKTGLGRDVAGGFLSIFKTGRQDYLFPDFLMDHEHFKTWRNSLGFVEDKLEDLYRDGLPWAKELGDLCLYTRFLPLEKHLVFVLLPNIGAHGRPIWLKTFNYIYISLLILMFVRGLILGLWAFRTISQRFALVFVLAISLPVTLFVSSAASYIAERRKADESALEQRLATSLLDFDAGKELLESDYLSAFSKISEDRYIASILREKAIAGADSVVKRVVEITSTGEFNLPLSGVAVYDLAGNVYSKAVGSMGENAFATMASFYGLPFSENLRQAVSQNEPDYELPVHNIDEKNLIAMQSFKRGDKDLADELERFRGRAVRTDIGRGHVSYIYDFIFIAGKPRYLLMIVWADSDVDRIIIRRAADKLAVRVPELKFLALKSSERGFEEIRPVDRSISGNQLKAFRRVAEAASSISSGMLKTVSEGMSVVAYSSKHFNRTIFLAGIDHSEMNAANSLRIIIFVILGGLGLILLAVSAMALYFRLIRPLQIVRKAFSIVETGGLVRLPEDNRNDEIGLLSREFGRMITGLEERRRLAALLSDQALEAVSNASEAGGDHTSRFNAVVLITDIRSFTTMCESYEPQIITRLLNIHFAEMAAIINANGGRIYKFIGDAIESVFVDNRDALAADRAVRASVQMLAKLKSINELRKSEGLFLYKIGIGMAYGSLTGGETGSNESRLDYAILGSAFKRAEHLEDMSRHYPDFPLLIDKSVFELLGDSADSWQKVQGADSNAYCAVSSAFVEAVDIQKSHFKTVEPHEKGVRIIESSDFLSEKWTACRGILFFSGILAVFLPLLAWVLSSWVSYNSLLSHEENVAQSWCKNAIEKLRVPDSDRVVFEEFMDNLCEETSEKLVWNSGGVVRSELEKAGSEILDRLNAGGLQPSLFAVLHKPGGPEENAMNESWVLTNFAGPDSQKADTQELLRYFAQKYYSGWPDVSHLRDNFQKLLGTGMTFIYLYNDLHARAVTLNRHGREEVFYWQPIYVRNPDHFNRVRERMDSSVIRSRPSDDALLQVGILLVMVPSERVFANHRKTMLSILSSDPVEFAILEKNGKKDISPGFPVDAGRMDYLTQELSVCGWKLQTAAVKMKDITVRVWAAKKMNMPVFGAMTTFSVILLLFSLLASVYWYKSVYRQSGMARRFSMQLWVGLIAAAVLPLSVAYTVNEWYAIEQRKMNLADAQMRLISSFDELERRQFLQEILEWDKLDSVSFNNELQRVIAGAEPGDPENLKNINTTLRRLGKEENSSAGRLRFSEAIIFHRSGWQHPIYSDESGPRDTGEFSRFLQGFVGMLMSDLGVSLQKADDGKLAGAVKEEMTRDAGLEIFRTVFGSDSYFRLVHGLDLPIKVFISTGVGCFKLIPVPSMAKPEMIIYWLFFDNLNSAMRKIFRTANSEFPVFSESKVMYGALKQPWTGGWTPEVARFARWALARKAPLSVRANLSGHEYLVESRIGSQNEVMIMTGLIPENAVIQPIEEARRYNLSLLGLSVMAILLLSLLIKSDLSTPISDLTIGVKMISQQRFDYRIVSQRQDELGMILHSFNGMAKALQEKERMGQMVSGAARRMASGEENIRLAERGQRLEVAVLYLAVPGFNLMVDSLEAEQLVREVGEHIDKLCEIILANGGEVDKIIGEKILAYFYSDEGVANAIKSAYATMVAIRNEERSGKLPFPVSVGIHCGEVIAGLLGVGSKRDYTIIGDPVNTAARICARGAELPYDRFLISENVLSGLEFESSRIRPFGEVSLKGKAATIKLYQALPGHV